MLFRADEDRLEKFKKYFEHDYDFENWEKWAYDVNGKHVRSIYLLIIRLDVWELRYTCN